MRGLGLGAGGAVLGALLGGIGTAGGAIARETRNFQGARAGIEEDLGNLQSGMGRRIFHDPRAAQFFPQAQRARDNLLGGF